MKIRGMLVMLALGMAAMAPAARAAELVVLSAAALKTAVSSLPPLFEAATGDRVSFVFGTAGVVRDKAVAGEAFDVVLVPPAPMADLVKRGLVVDGPIRNLGLVRLGAAVRGGAAAPAIATPDEFKAALIAAPSVAMADPASGATSGIYLAALLERLGVMDQVRPKLTLYPEGQVAMEAVARGEKALGLGQISEILPVQGARLIGAIPESMQLKTIYAAGLSRHSHAMEAAQRLLQFLQGSQARDALQAQGFEPAP